MWSWRTVPIATVAAIKAAGIKIHGNEKGSVGIPQGTPISAAFSNLYMVDFDISANQFCRDRSALYRRYSDDILVICAPEYAEEIEAKIADLVASEKLELSVSKTERTPFPFPESAPLGARSPQYLGFTYYPGGAGIRPESLSRQWRKMRRSIRRTRKTAEAAIAAGHSTKVFTKKLRRRFSPLQCRNFSSYARRSAAAFGNGEKISRQAQRLEREFERQISLLKDLSTE